MSTSAAPTRTSTPFTRCLFNVVILIEPDHLVDLRRVISSIMESGREIRLPTVKHCIDNLDHNQPISAFLRNPTDSEAQTQSGPGALTIQNDEGIEFSASGAFAVP
jgi:hypothetical protein